MLRHFPRLFAWLCAPIMLMLTAGGTPYLVTPVSADGPTRDKFPYLTRLPLGDGKVSPAPRVGYVFSCQTRFNGGGAFQDGPWIKSDGTFDLTKKATVDGAVLWPTHPFSLTTIGTVRRIVGNGLPNHATGQFPIAATDDAYHYDRNPNRITAQSIMYSLPLTPTLAATPTCLGMGAIGVTITGAVLFNALDAGGRDAVAHEVQDACYGHPQQNGLYHYHMLPVCLFKQGIAESELIGYALDGFPIYGPRDADGRLLVDSDLDACHGRTSEIDWNGQRVVMYHYHATYEYPYSLGCYRGTPVNTRP